MNAPIQPLSGPSLPPASGGTPKQLIVFLHGLGSDGNDLIQLAPLFAEIFPDAQFISPNAPFPCDMAPMGYQWFSLQTRDHEALLAGGQQATPHLNAFLDAQLAAYGLTEDKLALVGFSQGTMMSLYTAFRRPAQCAGIVGFSGALIGEITLEEEIKSKPPVCLIHGDADKVVPFQAMENARQILGFLGSDIETHARPGLRHGIDEAGLATALEFLKARL